MAETLKIFFHNVKVHLNPFIIMTKETHTEFLAWKGQPVQALPCHFNTGSRFSILPSCLTYVLTLRMHAYIRRLRRPGISADEQQRRVQAPPTIKTQCRCGGCVAMETAVEGSLAPLLTLAARVPSCCIFQSHFRYPPPPPPPAAVPTNGKAALSSCLSAARSLGGSYSPRFELFFPSWRHF